jgi:hypothetical protein
MDADPTKKTALSMHHYVLSGVLLVGLAAWLTFVGRTDRITYLGSHHDPGQSGFVQLETQPVGNYIIESGAVLAAMRIGCRYDLNFAVPIVHRRNRIKTVRSATLVVCPM